MTTTKLDWATKETGKPNAFFVMHKTDWVNQKICYSDNSETVATFMLAKQLSDYVLTVNGREYEWGTDGPFYEKLVARLEYLRNFDDVFYPPDEYPREHWWA